MTFMSQHYTVAELTIVEITKALKQMNPEAAEHFVQLYLGDILKNDVSE